MRDEYDFSKARRGPAIPSPQTTNIQAEVKATRQEQRGRPTHDAVVAELMRRPGVRQEVERIEREEDTRAEEFMLKDVAWGLRGQD